ncbi:MAG: hypothetical protein Q9190_001208 [Brigantiaea leucoxantha]
MDSAHRHDSSSSPNSAQGTESHHGTPETKLTVLSPEELCADQKSANRGILRNNCPPAFSLGAVPAKASPRGKVPKHVFSSQQHDPFVTPKASLATLSTIASPRLSPTASAFTPSGFEGRSSGNIVSQTLVVPARTLGGDKKRLNGNDRLSSTSSANTEFGDLSRHGYISSVAKKSTSSMSSQPMSARSTLGEDIAYASHFCSNFGVSRALLITQVEHGTPTRDIIELLNSSVYPSLKHLVLDNVPRNGSAFVMFTDVRDSIKSLSSLKTVRGDWTVQFLPASQIIDEMQRNGLDYPSDSSVNGEIIVKADFLGPSHLFEAIAISRLIIDLLGNYGDVMGYELGNVAAPMILYRVEFYDTRAADRATSHLNGFKIAGCILAVHRYKPGNATVPRKHANVEGHAKAQQEMEQLQARLQDVSLGRRSEAVEADTRSHPAPSYGIPNAAGHTTGYHEFSSAQPSPSSFDGSLGGFATPTSDYSSAWSPHYPTYPIYELQAPLWPRCDLSGHGTRAVGQVLNSNRLMRSQSEQHLLNRGAGRLQARHSNDFMIVHHNTVDVERIRQGTDVRTTISRTTARIDIIVTRSLKYLTQVSKVNLTDKRDLLRNQLSKDEIA